MYLVIDNSVDDQVLFYVYLNTKWVQGNINSNNKSLLLALTKFLSSVGKELKDIRGIAVVVGKGRFTSTRVAITMSNALALALKITVLAVDKFSADLEKQFAQTQGVVYASARYSAPANIGIKKQ